MSVESYPDFLIVGQGLAGTLLAHFLIKESKKVLVIDKPLPGASSPHAAGIVNPITGRRYAKSWRYEEFFPFAKKTYQSLETELGISIWHEMNILRALINKIDENEWDRRSGYDDYHPYMVEMPELGKYKLHVSDGVKWGELKQCAQVAMPQLIATYRKVLLDSGQLLGEEYDNKALEKSGDKWSYKGIHTSNVIFCEGARAVENPFFSYLPFSPTKGELLLVRIPGVDFDKMLKHKVFIVPLGNDIYWIGSTSRFEFEDHLPTQEKRAWLSGKLSELLNIPFEIIEHHAAIRPTVFDIRPFLGEHPSQQNLYIFNGLGTKGALLGPWFAHQLCGHLLGKNAIDGDVNILRFRKSE